MTKLEKRTQAVEPAVPFQTLAEEAEFWDSHSVIDEIDKGAVVGFRSARKTDSLTIRFEPDDISRIREEATQRGIGPTTLARMWVLEHLRGSHER
jgi:predicted DNA binding CopG/RHH family protein